jgi:hypothetical protein
MKKKEENKSELEKKLAYHEFINDQLISELAYVDQLMRQVGFTDGLESLKSTAKELFENGNEDMTDSDAA